LCRGGVEGGGEAAGAACELACPLCERQRDRRAGEVGTGCGVAGGECAPAGSITPDTGPTSAAWPNALNPQQATVPSLLSAHVCTPPTAIWVTADSPAGTADSPVLLLPQHTTVFSPLSAHVCESPAPSAVTPVSPGGTSVCP
jgi:hypothetical protein